MIVIDFFKSIAQLGDPRFMGVLIKGIGLALILLFGFYVLLMFGLSLLGAQAWLAETLGISPAWAKGALGIGGFFAMMGLSMFLMVPVASAMTSLFLDDVARAVESKHYPNAMGFQSQGFWEGLIESAKFLGVILAANAAALAVFVIMPVLGPLPFWITNGYLLGREFFIMTARRHMGAAEAKAAFRAHKLSVWCAGLCMAIPLSIPLVNLIIPTLGAASFTHQFHRLVKPEGID
ncbi:MAG: EI24 domain-containing protein [Planktomarina sp.]